MKHVVQVTFLAITLSTASLTAVANATPMMMNHGKPHNMAEKSDTCHCCSMMGKAGPKASCPCCSAGADGVCERMISNPHTAHTNGHSSIPSTRAYEEAMATMHKGMAIDYSGDADIDFLRGMIAHHQGAVDMARVQLKYGQNNQVRRLAQDIIRGQTLEIHWMETWLKQLEANSQRHVVGEKSLKPGYRDSTWRGDNWMGEY